MTTLIPLISKIAINDEQNVAGSDEAHINLMLTNHKKRKKKIMSCKYMIN
jgi:hypothetical protein